MSRILVVDDDADLRTLVGTYLKAAGHAVEFANDGVAGAEAVARQAPDLVVTDFQMPRMDGFSLFNAVRASPKAARVPVIMLTAHHSREMMAKALRLGIDEFLAKPIAKDELLEIVNGRLKAGAGAARAAVAVTPGVAAPTKPEFPGSVLCCRIYNLERFALELKKEELDELLDRFTGDAAIPVRLDRGYLVKPDFHTLLATYEGEDGGLSHAQRALRSALGLVLASQRLKPWIASRFTGRDLPEFVVGLGVHTGTIQLAASRMAGGVPALKGEAVAIAEYLAESVLDLGWSVAASRATAKTSGFSFLAGRAAQLRMPNSGSVKAVEVKGLEPRADPAVQPSRVATLIEAAVDGNANLVGFAGAVAKAAPKPPPAPPKPAAAPARTAPAPAAAPVPAPAPAPAAPPAQRTAALVREYVKDYEIVRKLADNGVVCVYLVNSLKGGAQAILKTILVAGGKGKRPHLEKFLQSYAAIQALENPNVAKTLGQGLTATHLFVVQEFCPGGDLRNLIAERMLPADVAKALARITGALRAAHQKNFIHGDLKPANVMIRADGSFALTDFALAKVIEYATAGEGESGVLLRSPEYFSPEMINNLPADPQSDIYTLGLLLYEMLTGAKAYASPDLSKVMMDHLNAPVPRLPEALAKFQPLLDKLMAKKREERFASMADVMAFMAQAKLGA